MTPHIRDSRKGISPVIATVILVAVAITVAISVAYWMGGISSMYTRLEKLEISSVTVTKNANSYAVNMTVRNTGSADSTVDNVIINGKPYSAYTPAIAVTMSNNGAVIAGSQGWVNFVVSSGTAPFTPGTTLDVKLHTVAGKDYPQMVTLT